MMCVVHLREEIGDRQLELVGRHAAPLAIRDEAEPGSDHLEDVRGVRDDERTDLEDRRRERAKRRARLAHPRKERFDSPTLLLGQARDVDVTRACVLQRKPHELAAPLDGRPVVEIQLHAVRIA